MTSISSIPDSPVAFVASASTSKFFVAGAASGCITPEAGLAIDGKVYTYTAASPDGSVWEYGAGAYSYADHSLARTTIYITSNGDQVPVVFQWFQVPVVSVTPSAPATLEPPNPIDPIDAGSVMLFQNAVAPTGWTRVTTFDDAALRVVGTGAPASGGTNAFSTVFAQTAVGGTTLDLTQIPAHSHHIGGSLSTGSGALQYGGTVTGSGIDTSSQGGGLSHDHTITMNIKYVDLIMASKN